MITKATFKLGEVTYQFEVEGDQKDKKDILYQLTQMCDVPRYCHACQNKHPKADAKVLASNSDSEGNKYVKVICGCGAQAKLGVLKNGTGTFWHDFVMWTPKEKGDVKP